MKKIVVFVFLAAVISTNCTTDEDPFICHLYGWIIREADSTTGVNDIVLKIWDINPYDVNQMRARETTTRPEGEDSLPGFFEMDSICYGTTKQQGTGYVMIIADNEDNPGYANRAWYPTIFGEVDTVTLYIAEITATYMTQ